MTIIHMEVDQCRSARDKMREIGQELESLTSSTINKGDFLVGTVWRAGGADQYLNELHDWQAELLNLLSKLKSLSKKLDSEIQEWLIISKEE